MTAGDRARELWRRRSDGAAYLVELEDDRVLAADGPLVEDELSRESLALRRASQGRSAAFTAEAAELDAHRGDYDRQRLEI
jgi:hypothetical protein